MKLKLLMIVFSVLLLSGLASAQTGTDNGTLDTVRLVVNEANTMVVGNDLKVEVQLWLYNDVQDCASVGVGFDWQSPSLQMDSAKMTTLAVTAFNFIRFLYKSDNIAVTNADKQFQFSGSRISGNGLVQNAAAQHVANYWLTYTGWTGADSLVFDTAAVGNTGFSFVGTDLKNWFPQFAGRVIWMMPSDVNVIGGSGNLPDEYSLDQNYPNPFNPTTNIRFSLPLAGEYKLTIYNVLGQVVEEFQDEATAPGQITVEWDAARQPSGVYFYRLESNSFSETKKMMLLK